LTKESIIWVYETLLIILADSFFRYLDKMRAFQ